MAAKKISFCFSQKSEILATTVDITWEIRNFSLHFFNEPRSLKSKGFVNEASGTRYSLEFTKIDCNSDISFSVKSSVSRNFKLCGSFHTKGGKHLKNIFQLTENIDMDLLNTLQDDFLKVFLHIDEPCDQTPEMIENISPAEALLSNLYKMFENEVLCDLSLCVCEDDEIFVHKTILAAGSPVFAEMFEHETMEKNKNRIEIMDFDIETVTRLVRFMYTCKAPEFEVIEVEDSMRLLRIANKYQVHNLKTCCSNYLMSTLNVVYVPELLQLADECNLPRLKEQCLELSTQTTLLSYFLSHLRGKPTLLTEVILQLQKDPTLE